MTNDAKEKADRFLRGIGLTDKPAEYGDGIHGWRCEYPDRYDQCDCFQRAVEELTTLIAGD